MGNRHMRSFHRHRVISRGTAGSYMPVVAHKSGAKLVIINRDETSCDDIADIVVKAQAGPTMASVLARVREALSKKQ